MSLVTQGLRFDAGGVDLHELGRTRLKRPQARFLVATILSVGVHAFLLVIFLHWVKLSKPLATRTDTIPVRIIELPATGLVGGGGGSPAIIRPHQTSHPVVERSRTAAMPQAKVHRHIAKRSVDDQMTGPSHLKFKDSPDSKQDKIDAIRKSMPVPGSLAPSGAAKAATDRPSTGIGAGNGSGNGMSSGIGSGAGYGTGGNGPRPVYAPLPTIPDDLRGEVMQVIAIVRFKVSHDGTAKVTLLSATDYSDLNEIILATLEQWRFKPATNNGVAIDSVADMRLLITVR